MKRILTSLLLLAACAVAAARPAEPPSGGAAQDGTRTEERGGAPADSPAEDCGAAQDGAQAEETEGFPAAGRTPDQLWDAAGTAYINGNYHEAITDYEQLLDRGLGSAKLYYNLANAYFKEDRLAEAILFYRRALRLAPGNEDIRYNLGVAEARTKDNIEQVPEFFLAEWLRGVRRTMSCTAWSVLSLVLLAGALALVLVYLLAQRLAWRKAGFYGMLLAGVLFAAATWLAAGERRELLDRSEAVVMSASAAVKSSPDNSATDLFVLHEGTAVRITERLDAWCEVTIADGKKGWIESRKIEAI